MIYSKVAGEGLPVLLLHGYGEDHSLWDDLSHSLANSFKIITLDLPGFGKSEAIPGQFSIDEVADQVASFLRNDLNISQFVVLGHSLGGYVALALAEHYAEQVLGFGLINSTSLADSPEKKENRIKTADFIRKYGAPLFLESFVPGLFAENNRSRLAARIQEVSKMGLNLDEKVLANYMLAMKDRPNRLDLLAKFRHVLFVGGEKDSIFAADDFEIQMEQLKNRDNGYILPNTGHMSMYEAPRELDTISFSFLNSV